jgi:putative two-component system response regulator
MLVQTTSSSLLLGQTAEHPVPFLWSPRILVADDVPANITLLTRILQRAGYRDIQTTTQGTAVPEIVATQRPDILLLDLHMPGVDGLQVIHLLRSEQDGRPQLPIIVLTGDSSVEARRSCLEAGASDFIGKPYDMYEVVLRVRNHLETRRLQLELAQENHRLENRVRQRTDQLLAARLDVLERLAIATEARDDDTGEHTRRVGTLAAAISECLGLDAARVQLIAAAAPLHDIGKIAIPDGVLNKPGKLTPDEFEIMKTHTIAGAGILAGGDHELIIVAEQIAISHHEHWDGGGYPHGLRGEAIPMEGRITAVADFFDAVTHDRVYRPAMPYDACIRMVSEGAGTHFDPAVVDAFLRLPESRRQFAA